MMLSKATRLEDVSGRSFQGFTRLRPTGRKTNGPVPLVIRDKRVRLAVKLCSQSDEYHIRKTDGLLFIR